MNLLSLINADANTLPYFIKEAQSGRRVRVRFEPLTAKDEAELIAPLWSDSVFSDVWPEYARAESALKLVRIDGSDPRIQGIIQVGRLTRIGGVLKKSLLEAAPFNQYAATGVTYQGTGRVLVARLVAESLRLGGEGKVLVRPRRDVEAFYKAIGFRASSRLPGHFVLDVEQAEILIAAALDLVE